MLVHQRYRIERFIARGGSGEVYEATDVRRDRRVALKAAAALGNAQDKVLRRLRRGVALAQQIRHPNVCRTFESGFHHLERSNIISGPVMFVTMELLSGETLGEKIRRDGQLSLGMTHGLLTQVVNGLAAAHDLGIIHRDLSTTNVMLVEEGSSDGIPRAVITDFGLARSGSGQGDGGGTMTDAGSLVGTPEYMAPEQLTGGAITVAVDVYALGLILYEMLTAARPFTGRTTLARAFQRLKSSPPSPRALRPELGDRWERTIQWCLAREPKVRLQDVREVLDLIGKPG